MIISFIVLGCQVFLTALQATFMFMTAWAFEARLCPTLLNEIKKTKLQTYTAPQAGINILLCTVPRIPQSIFFNFPSSINMLRLPERVSIKDVTRPLVLVSS